MLVQGVVHKDVRVMMVQLGHNVQLHAECN